MVRKKPTKRQRISRKLEKIAVLLQRLTRLKNADHLGYVRCCSCDKKMHWKEAQGGHFISRTHQSVKCVEEQIWPQCPGCNMQMSKGETMVMLGYQRFLEDMFGRGWIEELEKKARQPLETTEEELDEMLEDTKRRVKEAEKTIESLPEGFGEGV